MKVVLLPVLHALGSHVTMILGTAGRNQGSVRSDDRKIRAHQSNLHRHSGIGSEGGYP